MNCEQELTALRETIRNERKNKRITQEELAEMLEVSPTHVKHIESGHRKPSIEILFELAKILNISLKVQTNCLHIGCSELGTNRQAGQRGTHFAFRAISAAAKTALCLSGAAPLKPFEHT